MTATLRPPIARAAVGDLHGRWDGEVATFLGIPYAEPPVGVLRFAPPVAAKAWTGMRAADAAGPVPPQTPSRLEAVMGPMRAPDPDEDCLTLNVWTPAPSSEERRPVLVFLHGGGYMSGAGSAAWYDGTTMARRRGVVVVTINYRLGALGYLYLSASITGAAPVANLGLQDQRLALCWVRDNIAAFGGDEGRITVFGQSGGAHSVFGLAGMTGTEGLFRRAILESAPLGMPAAEPHDAERTAAIFCEAAGVTGRIDELRALPVREILRAQRATLMKMFTFGGVTPPFQLVVDGEVLTQEPVALGVNGSLDAVDLLVGYTEDEATPFFCFDESTWGLSAEALAAQLEASRGVRLAECFARYAARSAGRPPAAALCDLVSDEVMVAPAIALVEGRKSRGRDSHLFRFSWRSDALGGRLGACHTIELPFVFDNFAAWTQAPMLGGAQPAELTDLGDAVQDAWAAFATTGDPSHAGLPPWPAYASDAPSTMELAHERRLTDDPSAGRRELWL